jgi:hypothetical protein
MTMLIAAATSGYDIYDRRLGNSTQAESTSAISDARQPLIKYPSIEWGANEGPIIFHGQFTRGGEDLAVYVDYGQGFTDSVVVDGPLAKESRKQNARVEEELVNQLFNSSEKRLARALPLMTHFSKEESPEPLIATVSQATLAEMVGTTRARVSTFMNKFRKLGFVEYNGDMKVHLPC